MRCTKAFWVLALSSTLVTAAAAFSEPGQSPPVQSASDQVMLILRGVANSKKPHGQLDEQAALEYASRLGLRGEVLDVAGTTGSDSPQVRMALERIRGDARITAIYGFSGGGYNARLIWQELSVAERDRIRKVVVIGSPGVSRSDFAGGSDVVIKPDPPEGHLSGPKVLLECLGDQDASQGGDIYRDGCRGRQRPE